MKTKKLIEAARVCFGQQDECRDCRDCPLYQDIDNYQKMYKMLIDRLEELHEKNKAKKVKGQERQADNINAKLIYGCCPICGGAVNNFDNNYCGYCGQKLKWGDN